MLRPETHLELIPELDAALRRLGQPFREMLVPPSSHGRATDSLSTVNTLSLLSPIASTVSDWGHDVTIPSYQIVWSYDNALELLARPSGLLTTPELALSCRITVLRRLGVLDGRYERTLRRSGPLDRYVRWLFREEEQLPLTTLRALGYLAAQTRVLARTLRSPSEQYVPQSLVVEYAERYPNHMLAAIAGNEEIASYLMYSRAAPVPAVQRGGVWQLVSAGGRAVVDPSPAASVVATRTTLSRPFRSVSGVFVDVERVGDRVVIKPRTDDGK